MRHKRLLAFVVIVVRAICVYMFSNDSSYYYVNSVILLLFFAAGYVLSALYAAITDICLTILADFGLEFCHVSL